MNIVHPALVLAASTHHIKGPHIDWVGFTPFLILTGGGILVLLVGLLPPAFIRQRLVPLLTVAVLAATVVFEIARFKHHASIISGALEIDDLALILSMIFCVSALAAVLLSWRAPAPLEAGHGEYNALLLFSVLGMTVLVAAQNLITLFVGFELLSIPLYVLCASEMRREGSLESGLKYLVIGSVGSATLVYGLAMIYGATGSTDFSGIASAASGGKLAGGVLGDPLLFSGLALAVVGFAFKASVAPFHQWTPDVYEGAPTPVTAFMATATKAAALGVFLRFFDVAVIGAQNSWAPLIAAIAAITIVVGNVGALAQSSLKRMLGYSGVAQAGYMLGGVVVGTQLGIQATILYLAVYLAMNLAAFAVIAAQEMSTGFGDEISGLAGLGRRQPWLAWPMTIAMLSLAGIPGTVGFIGKFQLIHALVAGDYTWLAIVLVIGSMISLGYYLRVVATMWMGPAREPRWASAGGAGGLAVAGAPPIAGGSPEADPPSEGSSEGSPAGSPEGSSEGSLAGSPGTPDSPHAPEPSPDTPDSPQADPISPISGGVIVSRGPDSPEEPPPGHGEGGWPLSDQAIPLGEIAFVAVLAAAASIFFGIVPSPLFHLAAHAGHAISGIF